MQIFIIALILSILGLFIQQSKILTCIIFIFIWTLAWTTKQPDYINYEISYNNGFNTDLGYSYVSGIFKSIGLTYFEFRLILLGFAWLIYATFIIRFAKRCSLVAVLYLWTTSIYDMVQNRNFLAFSICLIGLSLILIRPSYRNQLIYILLIILASSIHITSLFFMIFFFANKNFINSVSRSTIIIISIISALVILFLFTTNVSNKLSSYDVGVSNLTRLLLIILFLFNFLFIRYVSNFKCDTSFQYSLTAQQNDFSSKQFSPIYYYNIALFLLLPAAFMSLNAMRIYRYMGILNISYVSNKLHSHILFDNVFYTLLIILYASSFALVSYLMHSTSFLQVVIPPFQYNIFYESLL